MKRSMTMALATACLAVLAGDLAPPASARDGDRAEERAAAACGRDASGRLRARSRDGAIRVDFDVAGRRSSLWRVTIIRDGRVAWRGRRRTDAGGRFRVRRTLVDYPGADRVAARAVGPAGLTCAAAVVLQGASW